MKKIHKNTPRICGVCFLHIALVQMEKTEINDNLKSNNVRDN